MFILAVKQFVNIDVMTIGPQSSRPQAINNKYQVSSMYIKGVKYKYDGSSDV